MRTAAGVDVDTGVGVWVGRAAGAGVGDPTGVGVWGVVDAIVGAVAGATVGAEAGVARSIVNSTSGTAFTFAGAAPGAIARNAITCDPAEASFGIVTWVRNAPLGDTEAVDSQSVSWSQRMPSSPPAGNP